MQQMLSNTLHCRNLLNSMGKYLPFLICFWCALICCHAWQYWMMYSTCVDLKNEKPLSGEALFWYNCLQTHYVSAEGENLSNLGMKTLKCLWRGFDSSFHLSLFQDRHSTVFPIPKPDFSRWIKLHTWRQGFVYLFFILFFILFYFNLTLQGVGCYFCWSKILIFITVNREQSY